MSLSIGIIGLPNAGKSTLFNALLKKVQAQTANYPFTTIEPNIGIVEVPDEHLLHIASSLSLSRKIPATIKFVDIAGLVKDAHKGEGLGNQFLARIRECDAILEVVRFFKDPNVQGEVNPEENIKTIQTELLLKDLEAVNAKIAKSPQSPQRAVLERLAENLNQGKPAREIVSNEKEKEEIKELELLTSKPILYVANMSEAQINKQITDNSKQFIFICAKLEADLAELSEAEAREYMAEVGIAESGLNKVIKEAYKLLSLITFYTLIPEKPVSTSASLGGQVQAWPILKNTKAPEAAGKIHADFERGFIKAEVINWEELTDIRDWKKAHEQGKVRLEGKDYTVQDGDVMLFKFNT